MLRLLERYEVSATWALVGHLFLDECERDASGRAHGDMVHPRQSHVDADWFHADPATDRARDPLWYGVDVLDAIQDAGHPQEIACHSFSHPQFGDPAMTLEAARSDLAACVRLATERGIRLKSFVFPRNSEGHHGALQSRRGSASSAASTRRGTRRRPRRCTASPTSPTRRSASRRPCRARPSTCRACGGSRARPC